MSIQQFYVGISLKGSSFNACVEFESIITTEWTERCQKYENDHPSKQQQSGFDPGFLDWESGVLSLNYCPPCRSDIQCHMKILLFLLRPVHLYAGATQVFCIVLHEIIHCVHHHCRRYCYHRHHSHYSPTSTNSSTCCRWWVSSVPVPSRQDDMPEWLSLRTRDRASGRWCGRAPLHCVERAAQDYPRSWWWCSWDTRRTSITLNKMFMR